LLRSCSQHRKRRHRNQPNPSRLHDFIDHLSATIPDSTAAEMRSQRAYSSASHTQIDTTCVEPQADEDYSGLPLQTLRVHNHQTYSEILFSPNAVKFLYD
jgi:hypothetical protein